MISTLCCNGLFFSFSNCIATAFSSGYGIAQWWSFIQPEESRWLCYARSHFAIILLTFCMFFLDMLFID
jgi:hypothetical protein